MSAPAILITECLQNDFVKPVGRYDPLPNLLHVGHAEAQRLMGESPDEGPLARTMRWATEQARAGELLLVHVRDWHDPDDATQDDHLARFGAHCVAGSEGAAFAWPDPVVPAPGRVEVVDALSLNDFLGTRLAEVLAPLSGTSARVGLMGVWTEAKLMFLAYELRTRYPRFRLAVCSALCASSSRARHFLALDQLERILGVTVVPSVGAFIELLGGEALELPLIGYSERHPEVTVHGEARFEPEDEKLLRYLYRDCRRAELRTLDGGFSGNVVLGSESHDLHGHRQVPHVVKIGPRDAIGRERTAFERIQAVLGNSAPSITDFADLGERGAIRYRYASMGGGFSTTFQKLYSAGADLERLGRILDSVFREQLGRLYGAAQLERLDLLEHYAFSPRWAPGVRRRVEGLLGGPAGQRLAFPGEREVESLCGFYEQHLARIEGRATDSCFVAFVHGDLNGANIIVDGHDNVWIIDFFHTDRGHVLKDLIKLENDLLYIFTPLSDEGELEQALSLTDRLLAVEDLAAPLPGASFAPPALERAWRTVGLLRGFYPELIRHDRDPLQLLIGQLRYAAHTLGFDESSDLQRRWALYTACRCAEEVVRRVEERGALRVDWLETELAGGFLGLTLMPGRRDLGRDLARDIEALKGQGVTHVLCLLTTDEIERYGPDDLVAIYREAGLETRHLPMLDQRVCSREEMEQALGWIGTALEAGGRVMVHCLGGLGRSGTVAACHLRRRGLDAEAALVAVRAARSPRAVESAEQEAFVRAF